MFETLDGGLMSKYWGHVVAHHLLKFIKKKIHAFQRIQYRVGYMVHMLNLVSSARFDTPKIKK